MISRIQAYFERLQAGSTIKFIIVLALIAFFIKVPAGIVGALLIQFFDLTNPMFSSVAQEPTFTPDDMFLAIVFAPVIETLLGQLLPIELLRRVVKSPTILITLSSLLFMALHYPVLEFCPSAFAVGCVFAWAWVAKRDLGWLRAGTIVTLIHSMHNALVAAVGALVF